MKERERGTKRRQQMEKTGWRTSKHTYKLNRQFFFTSATQQLMTLPYSVILLTTRLLWIRFQLENSFSVELEPMEKYQGGDS